MKKRILAIIISVMMIISVIPITAHAENGYEGICGENISWRFDPETGTLTVSGRGEIVFERPEGQPWEEPYAPWYEIARDIKSAVFEEGITNIPGNCFHGYYYDYGTYFCPITSVSIPESVISIGEKAFYSVHTLEEIKLPGNLRSIGNFAFGHCSALKEIVLPESLESIGNSAFRNMRITSIDIPANVESIGCQVLAGCNDLSSITVDPGNAVYHSDRNCLIETASKTMIAGCRRSIIPFDGSVTAIEGAFCELDIEQIAIPEGIVRIGSNAFSDCTSLKKVVLPESVTEIGDRAFYRCGINDINIPSHLEVIGASAFNKCYTLADVILPSTVVKVGISAFRETEWYNAQPDMVYIGDIVLGYKFTAPDGATVVIDDGTRVIADAAFSQSQRINKIVLPDSVERIGKGAFNNATGLRDVYFKGTPEQWENVLIEEENECFLRAEVHFGECWDHVPGDWEILVEPTENEWGLKVRKCTVCGKTVEEEWIIPPNMPVFSDVVPTSWYAPAVDFVFKNEYMIGLDNNWFGVSETLTRAQIIQILYKIAGAPGVSEYDKQFNHFFDVDKDAWYYYASIWAKVNNISLGVATGSNACFAPDEPVTRADLSLMILRFIDYYGRITVETNEYTGYADQDEIPEYALVSVKVLSRAGIMVGDADRHFCPNAGTTRAEAATVVKSLLEKTQVNNTELLEKYGLSMKVSAYQDQQPYIVMYEGQERPKSRMPVISVNLISDGSYEGELPEISVRISAEAMGLEVVDAEAEKEDDRYKLYIDDRYVKPGYSHTRFVKSENVNVTVTVTIGEESQRMVYNVVPSIFS
ncbi:MAG: leucine-rich repeat protein [Clostridia bacterium]|nr:leucine-rich repeat protein [Clostridia bacterium]